MVPCRRVSLVEGRDRAANDPSRLPLAPRATFALNDERRQRGRLFRDRASVQAAINRYDA
jgi:hypothetical protein